MSIEFACECGRRFKVREEQAGRSAKCPSCGRALVVPHVGATAAPAATPTTPAARPAPQRFVPRPAAAAPPPQAFPAAAYPPAQAAYAPPPAPDYGQATDYAQAPAAYASPSADYADTAQHYAPPPSEAGWPPPAEYAPPSSTARSGKKISEYHSLGMFIVLGVGLLLGFGLPVTGFLGGKTSFINIEMLSEKGIPMGFKVMCLAPAVCGIAVLILAGLTRGVIRGGVIAGLGLIPFALLFVEPETRGFFRIFSQSEGEKLAVAVVLGLLAWIAMLGGVLGLRHRPDFRPLVILALAGGVLYTLYLFLPLGPGEGLNAMPIVATFNTDTDIARKGSGMATFGMICMVGSMLCNMAMAVLCVGYGAANRMTRGRAQWALGLWIASIVITGMALVGLFSSLDSRESGQGMAILLVLMKMILWMGGLMMMVPIGLSEFLLGMAARGKIPDSVAGFPVQMMPPAGMYPPQGYPQQQYPGQYQQRM